MEFDRHLQCVVNAVGDIDFNEYLPCVATDHDNAVRVLDGDLKVIGPSSADVFLGWVAELGAWETRHVGSVLVEQNRILVYEYDGGIVQAAFVDYEEGRYLVKSGLPIDDYAQKYLKAGPTG